MLSLFKVGETNTRSVILKPCYMPYIPALEHLCFSLYNINANYSIVLTSLNLCLFFTNVKKYYFFVVLDDKTNESILNTPMS